MIEFEDIICCITEYENFEAIPGEVIHFAVRLINTKAKEKITVEELINYLQTTELWK